MNSLLTLIRVFSTGRRCPQFLCSSQCKQLQTWYTFRLNLIISIFSIAVLSPTINKTLNQALICSLCQYMAQRVTTADFKLPENGPRTQVGKRCVQGHHYSGFPSCGCNRRKWPQGRRIGSKIIRRWWPFAHKDFRKDWDSLTLLSRYNRLTLNEIWNPHPLVSRLTCESYFIPTLIDDLENHPKLSWCWQRHVLWWWKQN